MPKYCIYICIFMPRLLLSKVIKKCSCKFLIYYNLLRNVAFVLFLYSFQFSYKKKNKKRTLNFGFNVRISDTFTVAESFISALCCYFAVISTDSCNLLQIVLLIYVCARTPFIFERCAMWLRVLSFILHFLNS